ncbi:hypothetical protein SAMN05443999_10192 [Roseovarius azorensis]|uniref:Arginine transporter n=1 Tax=Roseovarius azorensis TaxID=1287727 RepID=A0A1H7FPF6_9RHOB|nr:hypothetical protein [Roseovarius azorensis]SEK26030.1 hypothetical protein SAMN05443999_10192 [Roseovarius azorensis]
MKQMLTLGLVMVLAGCGGGDRHQPNSRAASGIMPMASGPINTACLQSDRKARSRALCGCIQAVAHQTLSGAEQRRAVQFYKDPQMAQDIRQSSRPADQRFWQAYRAYGDRAEQVCT